MLRSTCPQFAQMTPDSRFETGGVIGHKLPAEWVQGNEAVALRPGKVLGPTSVAPEIYESKASDVSPAARRARSEV